MSGRGACLSGAFGRNQTEAVPPRSSGGPFNRGRAGQLGRNGVARGLRALASAGREGYTTVMVPTAFSKTMRELDRRRPVGAVVRLAAALGLLTALGWWMARVPVALF